MKLLPIKEPFASAEALALILLLLSFSDQSNSLLAQTVDAEQAKSGEISFYGRLLNKTTGQPARAEQLSLIRLSGGMQVVETIKTAGPRFRFAPIARPTTPHLIRAIYRGGSYSSLIPPTEEYIRRSQTILVYDPGALPKDMKIVPIMWVTKREMGLLIEKVFLMENSSNPPRSFDARGLAFFVPKGAEQLSAHISYDQFPIPLQLQRRGASFALDRSVRPGRSELRIQYRLEGWQFADRLLIRSSQADLQPLRLLFWQPQDARPQVSGGEARSIEIPRLGPALQIEHALGGEISYDFSAGGMAIERPLESDANPLFNSAWKTTAALLVSLTGLLILISFFAAQFQFR